MPFQNTITGGNGALIRPAIKSPNFVHGVSGWSINKNGTAEFQSIIVPPGSGGATVFIQSATPTANAVGDLWFNTTAGKDLQVTQWNGSSWVAYQYGTGAITPGAITSALIAANTIVAGNIAAGAITAAKLAAGIIYAGIVNGTTITGANFISDGTGQEIMVYSGTPALGNLIMSDSATSGIDSLGNAYAAGVCTYVTGQTGQFFGAGITLTKASGALAAPIVALVDNVLTNSTRLLTTGLSVNLTSAANAIAVQQAGDTVPRFAVDQNGSINLSSGAAAADTNMYRRAANLIAHDQSLYLKNVSAPAGDSTGVELYGHSGVLHVVESSTYDGGLVASQASTASFTVVGTGASQLSAQYSIPANDANATTAYRLICGGTGTWGSTQQQLTLIESFTATAIVTLNVASTAFPISTAFSWELMIEIICVSTGSGGTAKARLRFMATAGAPAVNTNSVVAVRQATGVAFNTTAAQSLRANANWASTTGAPTITEDYSTFERLGA